jgi:hypothetical protein
LTPVLLEFTPLLLVGAGELDCSDWLFEPWFFEDLSLLLRELIEPVDDGSRGVVVLSAWLDVPDALEAPVAELPAPTADVPLLPADDRLLVSVVLPESLLPVVLAPMPPVPAAPVPVVPPLIAPVPVAPGPVAPVPVPLLPAPLLDVSGSVVPGLLLWRFGSFCDAGGVDIAVEDDCAGLASSFLRLQAVNVAAVAASNTNVEAMTLGLFMVSPGESPPMGGW